MDVRWLFLGRGGWGVIERFWMWDVGGLALIVGYIIDNLGNFG